MMDFLRDYHPLFDFFLLNVGFAFSQQIVLRAGVFSVATVGFAGLGAYCSAIMVKNYGFGEIPALLCSMALGMVVGFLLSLPLARVRGVYQAIATLAFVQIVVALVRHFEGLTGGALGIDRIPRLIDTWQLLAIVGVVVYIIYAIGKSGVGRAFDTVRQDETVGIALGISIRRYHTLAFVLSGAIGGLFGGMQALTVYVIEPGLYGFNSMVTILTFIVVGGRGSVLGPIIGTAVIVALPEISRPLAEYRQMVLGALIVVMINYLPNGLYDSLILLVRQRRAVRLDKQAKEKVNAVACA